MFRMLSAACLLAMVASSVGCRMCDNCVPDGGVMPGPSAGSYTSTPSCSTCGPANNASADPYYPNSAQPLVPVQQ